jgi:RNA polymerase sigma-70 factor, ECF subfamily
MAAIPERTLLARARDFNPAALAEIYDLYSPGVYRYAYRLLGDPCQAEDCVADTFSRFLIALRGGGGPQDALQAYLYRVAHNWITDQYRRQPPPPLELDEEAADRQPGVEESVAQRQQADHLRAALVRLTPDQRQVVVLKYLEGWENEKIAAILEKPVGAVKALQHRAVESLHRMLLAHREETHE